MTTMNYKRANKNRIHGITVSVSNKINKRMKE